MLVSNINTTSTSASYRIFKLIPTKTRYLISYRNIQDIVSFIGTRTTVNQLAKKGKIIEMEFFITSDEERFYLLDFFRQVRGNVGGFWFPVYASDIRFYDYDTNNNTQFIVYHNNLFKSFLGYEHLVYYNPNDYSLTVRKIQSIVEIDNNFEKIILEDTILNLTKDTNLHKLIYGRFLDSDLQIQYRTTAQDKYIASAVLKFIELPEEGVLQ